MRALTDKPYLAIAGDPKLLQNITTFCRQVYYRAFGSDEGERRLRALTLTDAVALWRAGLPQSLTIH